MNRIFDWIARLISKRPIKVFLITTLIFTVMVSGAISIRMATGNETFVKTTSDAYQWNLNMEKNFGGDSIIVLFEGENEKDLLSLENVKKMWNVQQILKSEKNIFSLMSPASVVNQIADKQSEEIKSRLKDISDGLLEISEKMGDIGVELGSKELKDPVEIEREIKKLSQAADAFDKLIIAQNKMAMGSLGLKSGLMGVGDGIGQVSLQLQDLSKSVSGNPQMSAQLQMISQKLQESSKGINTMAGSLDGIKKGTSQTSQALENMSKQIGSQASAMKNSLSDGFSPDEIKEMAEGFISMEEKLRDISDGLNTFYDKSGMMVADIPTIQAELDTILYDDEGKMRSVFSDVMADDNASLMVVKLAGNLDDAAKDEIYLKLDEALKDQEFTNISYTVSGKPVLDTSLRSEMKDNMKMMVGLAVLVMFVILMLVFRVRWRVMPLVTVFIAVIATLGFMGAVGIPMTMVSMAVFPILIGLGIDYSIQFQNRYQEERSIGVTLRQMGPAVGTAVFATVLGFIALYASPVPMIQDFGKMLTIGVIISYGAGIFLLMSILYIRDHFSQEEEKIQERKEDNPSWLEKKLRGMTAIILKSSVFILIAAVGLTTWGIIQDGKVGVQTDIESFMPQDTPALADIHKLRDRLGSTDQVVLYLEGEDILAEDNLMWIDQTTAEIREKYPDIIVDSKSITSVVRKITDNESLSYEEKLDTISEIPDWQKKIFLTDQNDKAVILLNIKHLTVEKLQEFIGDLKSQLGETDMTVKVTGKSVLDVEMIKGLTSGRVKMTFLGMGLLFLGLLLIYRNLIKAFIPVFPISLIVGMSGGIMSLLNLKYTPLTSTLGALILGVGTEMTIMLLERYVEERNQGIDKVEAMKIAVSKIGQAIIASGLTTVGGFGVLMISQFVILKDFGLMTLINVSLALFSTLVVLPPVILWLDRWITNHEPTVEGEGETVMP